MTNELNLSRQSKLVPYDDINKYNIKVFGVGSVGSHVVKTLAKAGFKNIEVYDMDTVEEENISAQAYDFKHIGMKKTEALKDLVFESTGIEIVTNDGLVTKETEIEISGSTIYCCFFDSIEARQMIFDKLKGYPVLFVDARIGAYYLSHYLVRCNDSEDVRIYETTLDSKVLAELACGEKACAPVNLIISGKIVISIVDYIKGDNYVKTFIGNAECPKNDIIVMRDKPVNIDELETTEPDEIDSLNIEEDYDEG